jgi:type II secretory pathway pseudopilin PulG
MRTPPANVPARCRRARGASLVEVVAAVTVFAIGITCLGTQWVHARQQLTLIRERQVLARIVEARVEGVRSLGPFYLPDNPAVAETHYFDARGWEVAAATADGYRTQTWVTYLQNPASFTDGTGGTVGGSSLREVRVWAYKEGVAAPLLQSTTYMAPYGLGSAY